MKCNRVVLSNGLRVLHVPMKEMQSVSMVLYIGLGSRFESRIQAGISHLIEHMLFKGTHSKPRARDISQTIEAVGGVLNASTDKEVTAYWTKTARDHVPLAIGLLADMLQNSRLRPSDLVREKNIIAEELAMLADDPQDWVHVLADEVLWPNQPLGREIAGTRDSVMKLTRRAITQYLDRFYGPNNAVVSIAGGIERDAAFGMIADAFGSWSQVQPDSPSPAEILVNDARFRLESRPLEQVNLCVVYPGLSRRHSDRWALDVLTTILGGGTSSRLFVGLRELLGLVYDVQMYCNHFNDTGAIVISAAMDPRHSPRSIGAILREVDRVRARGISGEELHRAQQFFRGRLALGLEDTHSVASWFGGQEILQHEVMTPEAAAAAVDAVTTADVRRVARDYLRPDLARLAAVGPAAGLDLQELLATA